MKDEGLNWYKNLMKDWFQNSLKLEGPKTYLTHTLILLRLSWELRNIYLDEGKVQLFLVKFS